MSVHLSTPAGESDTTLTGVISHGLYHMGYAYMWVMSHGLCRMGYVKFHPCHNNHESSQVVKDYESRIMSQGL